MSVFKRAEWHSGLTYQQTCRECNTVVQYTDEILDFRPWYADGFVYCPRCNTPLRHNEVYAIDGKEKKPIIVEEKPVETPVPAAQPEALSAFCHQCGKKFFDGDRFCVSCGTKRR